MDIPISSSHRRWQTTNRVVFVSSFLVQPNPPLAKPRLRTSCWNLTTRSRGLVQRWPCTRSQEVPCCSSAPLPPATTTKPPWARSPSTRSTPHPRSLPPPPPSSSGGQSSSLTSAPLSAQGTGGATGATSRSPSLPPTPRPRRQTVERCTSSSSTTPLATLRLPPLPTFQRPRFSGATLAHASEPCSHSPRLLVALRWLSPPRWKHRRSPWNARAAVFTSFHHNSQRPT
mmetsp:Transcript_30159/g.70951  ORF Transcript_30159/g.70951 Transcript_30159/m.70951 type:complete len:229 (-) Transcript_30159:199-885(-)